ncbi:hypothetical protein [Diaminobutyricimonas sp. LJ205]|uniref:hypothetical protein n=1 Tax=Diaminobutyricimonas sp. LJ205 TaxID=2683590 RepID=UPI0012F48386|nr:hypothetical protein [Diaminobutyricimonas sp. LJ205]
MSPEAFTSYARDRLAEGVVSAPKMRQLAPRIDKYIAGLLAAAKAPALLRTQAIGAFEPTPPEFSDSLAELALRIKRSPQGHQLARQVEYVIHERLVRQREPSESALIRLGANLQTAIPSVAAFLRTYAGLPPDLSAALVGADGTRPVASDSPVTSHEPLADLEMDLDAVSALEALARQDYEALFEFDEPREEGSALT